MLLASTQRALCDLARPARRRPRTCTIFSGIVSAISSDVKPSSSKKFAILAAAGAQHSALRGRCEAGCTRLCLGGHCHAAWRR
jgi:hypothetical protein